MTISKKLKQIRNHEGFKDIDAMFIINPKNIMYLLGFKIESETLIVIPNDEKINISGNVKIFLNALEFDEANNKIQEDNELSKYIEIIKIPLGNSKFTPEMIKNFGYNCVGFEEDYTTMKKINEWKQQYKIPNFIGLSDAILNTRLIKMIKEIELLKEAAKLGDIGFKTIYNSIKEGMTERDLAAEAEYAMRKAGSDGTAFNTIVATGINSSYPHATVSDKIIKDGDIVLVDIGATFKGYHSDLSRTFIFGKVDKEKAKLINMVNESQKIALNCVKVGISCNELDKVTRDFFTEKKKEWSSRFIHSLGHGVGLDIHERPFISSTSQELIQENMVITIEPGLYIPGLGGARTEDLILIQKESYKSLSNSKIYYY